MSSEDWITVLLLVLLIAIVLVVGVLLATPHSTSTYYANTGDAAVATEIHELRLDMQKLSTQLAGDKR